MRRFRFSGARAGKAGLAGVVVLVLTIVAADLLFPPPLSRADDIGPIIVDRDGRWLHAFTNDDDRWRFRASLSGIDPVFLERLILIEDKRFWRHAGVDPLAILRASKSAVLSGRVVSGASTITMQTARLLEPRPRTLGAKLIEMFRAAQIERRLSKQQILELYLTLAPYGGNIEGVRAASLIYFGKEPSRLTDAEQALLIALPQAPEARRPDLRHAQAKNARAEMLGKLAAARALSPALAAEAAGAALPGARHRFPTAGYHVSSRLARSMKSDGYLNDHSGGQIASTVDLDMQLMAERMVRRHAAQLDDGATAAALIIDNKSREVRAHVGSSGVDAPGGWIDLTAASRSPGSLLKPFIYALAFEDGIAGPDTVIDDMPRAFGGYSPENFDRTFRGEVRIRDALQHSLNLPAVTMLSRIGAGRFSAAISAAGVDLRSKKRPEKKQGLALALGGAGVTAHEVGALYAGLANGGAVAPLRWVIEEKAPANAAPAFQLFSNANAARINDILTGAPSLAGRSPSALAQEAPSVAFKTGTSYGYRDAWAAGHAGAYTIVVWVGRADGAPRPGATGRKAAAPLLFDLFDQLALIDPDQPRVHQPGAPSRDIALKRFEAPAMKRPPEITFPRDGVEIFADRFDERAKGFALAARGGAGGYRWYVDGDAVALDETGRRAIWRPQRAGFYDVIVVDEAGRQARSKIRVRAG